MNTTQTTHPSHENLAAFNSGRLGVLESAEVERHLADCEACCRLLTTLPNETLISLLGPQSDTKAEATPSLPPQQPNEPRPVLEATIIGGDFKTQAEGRPSTTLSTEVPAELQGHPRYRIQALLGRGGMGSVYQAEHRLMNRPVALKVIDRQLVQTPGLVERFHREVQAAAKLSHPNIVTAYDAEQAGDLHYLVMELVEGQDLAEVVRQRGRLPIQEACEYVRQAAQGLQHAFERGMVHRDIKPQNLMLQASPVASAPGVIKILDFGLAQFATEIAETSGLTQVGSIMGTPDYMAPEQARDAHSADIRADIYSLGCTLYCLLSGGAPFPQGSIVEKIMAHVERQPKPLPELRPDAAPGLAAVLAKMMAKAPVDRFQTPAEVAEALLPFASPDLAPKTSSLIPQAATRRPRSPLFIATSVLGVLATLVLLGVIVIVTDQGRIEVRSEVDDVELLVKRGGEQIDIIDVQTGSKATWFFSGEYKLELKGDRNDIEIRNDSFQLTRWGKKIVTLKRKAVEPATTDPPKEIAKDATPGWHGWTKEAPPPAIAPFDAEQAKQHQEAWAKYLGVRAEYTNSVGMKFRLIPPGEFLMGSTPENVDLVRKLLKQYFPDEASKWEEFLQAELPQHKVILTKPFYLGVHEVTQAQYAKVMGENPSHFSATGGGKEAVAGMDTSSFPAEMLSWHDAVDFCAKLSQHEKLSMPASGSGAAKPAYRLPTEAEWEFACRAGTTARFWFGDQFQNLEKAGWAGTNRTHAVGELNPNPFALYDMHGNVGEWAQDLWEPHYYAVSKDKPALDPACLTSSDLRRVARGGFFHSTWIPCQSSSRVAGDPFARMNHAGMRVALSVNAVRQATEKPAVTTPVVPTGTNLITDPSLEATAVGEKFPTSWGSGNLIPPGAYKFAVAEGGKTGKRGWLIEGDGQYAVVPTNRPGVDRALRYGARGWVRLEAGSAQLKILYFDGNGRYLGENRSAITNKRDGWQQLTMLDDLAKWPEARYLSLALTLIGKGKAVFDDLEFTAFDATKLPANFEKDYASTPKHDPALFDRWAGRWESVTEYKATSATPAKTMKGETVVRKVLEDQFLLWQSKDESGSSQYLSLLGFDENAGSYHIWIFGSAGEVFERTGQWDAASQTLALDLKAPSPGVSGLSTDRFTDKDHIESLILVKDARGQITRDIRATWVRKAIPLPAEIELSGGPAAGSAELALLQKMAGDWTIRSTSKPSVWEPKEKSETFTEQVAWTNGGRFLIFRAYDETKRMTSLSLMTYEPKESSYHFWTFAKGVYGGQWRITWDASSRAFHWRSIDMPVGWIGTGFNRWIDDDTFDNQALIKDENGRVLLDSTQEKRRKK